MRMNKKGMMLLAGISAAGLLITGCSSGTVEEGASGSNAAGEVDQATIDLVESASADSTFNAPANSVDIVPDQTIAVIQCAAANSGCIRVSDGVVEAAELVGWNVVELDGQGQASGQNTAVMQAVSQGVDGIILAAFDSGSISQGMAAAAEAGIPVVSLLGDNVVGDGPTDVFAEPDSGSEKAGAVLGAFAVVESDGAAKVATLSTDELIVTRNRTENFVDQIEACNGCEIVDQQNYLISNALTDVPLIASSIIQNNPDLDYIFVDIGQFGAMTAAAIEQSGSDAQVLSVDCNPEDIVLLRDGKPQAACAAHALEAAGFAGVAALNYALAGESSAPAELEVPTKLVTPNNLPAEDLWTGDFDLAAEYKNFWGVN